MRCHLGAKIGQSRLLKNITGNRETWQGEETERRATFMVSWRLPTPGQDFEEIACWLQGMGSRDGENGRPVGKMEGALVAKGYMVQELQRLLFGQKSCQRKTRRNSKVPKGHWCTLLKGWNGLKSLKNRCAWQNAADEAEQAVSQLCKVIEWFSQDGRNVARPESLQIVWRLRRRTCARP